MDTRTKIVPWAEFARTDPAEPGGERIVIGYFDPLAADHVGRLEDLAREHGPLAVAVDTPPDPLLPAEARAQLVAALGCVVRVAAVNSAPGSTIAAAGWIDERPAHIEIRRALIERIHFLHRA